MTLAPAPPTAETTGVDPAFVGARARRMGRDHIDQCAAFERLFQPVIAVQAEQQPQHVVGQILGDDHQRNISIGVAKGKQLGGSASPHCRRRARSDRTAPVGPSCVSERRQRHVAHVVARKRTERIEHEARGRRIIGKNKDFSGCAQNSYELSSRFTTQYYEFSIMGLAGGTRL